ncbi:tRNA adenosine(34) deaminase TadA [Litoribrevibacter albus]|nr:tRNA adenosine(34) deaminase TadA [Litoribrevibacter albus]
MTTNQQTQDQHWMKQALKLAANAWFEGEVPVGAVVVRDNQIIGQGWNRPISSSDPTAHAEIQCLRDASTRIQNYRLVDTTLYVTVEPCAMCAGAIIHSRVSRVVFGAAEPKAGAVCSHQGMFEQPQFNHVVEWQGGVLEASARLMMQRFFKYRRKPSMKTYQGYIDAFQVK